MLMLRWWCEEIGLLMWNWALVMLQVGDLWRNANSNHTAVWNALILRIHLLVLLVSNSLWVFEMSNQHRSLIAAWSKIDYWGRSTTLEWVLVDLGWCKEQSRLESVQLAILVLNELKPSLLGCIITWFLSCLSLITSWVVVFEELQEVVLVNSHKAYGLITGCINKPLWGWAWVSPSNIAKLDHLLV